MGDALSEIFDDLAAAVAVSPENLFTILEPLQDTNGEYILPFSMFEEPTFGPNLIDDLTAARMPSREYSNVVNSTRRRYETDEEEEDAGGGVRRKKLKLAGDDGAVEEDGQPKVSHITVERNRRKQMNEHLVVLRSLMPCFYVKRGDQASIIGGVVDYIKELQQLLKSLEAKKQRKVYSEVLSSPRPPLSSPRPLASPRPLPPLPPSPCRPAPLCSPRVSPGTPQPVIMSPYKPKPLPNESPSPLDAVNYRSSYRVPADVEVKLSGPNVVLKTASHRIPGQALKIITVLEGLALEILHVSISTMEDTMLFSFTIKIGIECELSAEELAQEIQQTFS